jgi:leader peptidase (prepilin peptidase)/N-methyltransferase
VISDRVFPGVGTPNRLAATGMLAVGVEAAMVWRFGWSAALPAYLVFGMVAATVTMTDIWARKIPEALVLPAYPLGGALLAIAAVSQGRWWPLARGGIAMVLLGSFYLILGLAFAGQFGIGDIELGGLLGLYLGFLGWSALASGTLAAWLLAALAVMARLAAAHRTYRGALAAGPFLAAGALLAVLAVR